MRRLAHILVTAALLLLQIHPVDAGPSGTINGAESTAGTGMIPAGPFLYGEKGKEQELSLPAFMMDLYEVTNAEYAKVRPREYPPEKANHPVVGITWDEAKQYCETVGKRLPSEQEWEKAARGTDGRRFPWGDTYDPKKLNAEGRNNGTTPVGQFPDGRSPYGLYDMAGKAWGGASPAGGGPKPPRGGGRETWRAFGGGKGSGRKRTRVPGRRLWVPAAR